MSPEALAGKTGHLKMEVTYTNTSKTTKTVNGKTSDIYSPFVMVTGMILSTDNFSNITVDNGKVISDGSRNVVVGFGMPGMKMCIRDRNQTVAYRQSEEGKSVLLSLQSK